MLDDGSLDVRHQLVKLGQRHRTVIFDEKERRLDSDTVATDGDPAITESEGVAAMRSVLQAGQADGLNRLYKERSGGGQATTTRSYREILALAARVACSCQGLPGSPDRDTAFQLDRRRAGAVIGY